MKKFMIALSIIGCLSFSNLEAKKPQYCYDALETCYAKCKDMFSSDYFRSACYGGCLIGFMGCGSAK